jgi:1-acyl-sn-glycerol-3-phosphate acyltransferase
MPDASPAPEPTYSVRPVWAVAIAYALNLAVVFVLQSYLLSSTVEMEYYRGVQLGSLAGLIVGVLLWAWTTRFRATGLVAWAAPILAIVLAITAGTGPTSPPLGALAGFLSCVGLLALFWHVASFPHRRLPVAVFNRLAKPKTFVLFETLFAAFLYTRLPLQGPTDDLMVIALIPAILLALWSWATLHRAATEIFFEVPLTVAYAIRCGGPGLSQLPSVGPVLVVANHACWFDPLFVSKALPRPATPMMTARFYSIWFIRPLLKYIFRVIVVPESPMRREAPELKLAIAALDRGECVMLFPEGYLRRKEEIPLRRFGQGVWQILKDRPNTPVVACWVEGGWGAWCSFFNGLPTKNKKMDVRRPIRVGLSEPEAIPAELLGDHLRTRVYLMNRVRAVRGTLGLPELPVVELPARSDVEEAVE